jgi:hypothetical protein
VEILGIILGSYLESGDILVSLAAFTFKIVEQVPVAATAGCFPTSVLPPLTTTWHATFSWHTAAHNKDSFQSPS